MSKRPTNQDAQAYLAAQAEHERSKEREQDRYAQSAGLYIQQIVITFGLSVIGIVILLWLLGTAFVMPCISNFYDDMPIYPDAEQIENNFHFYTWLGLGDLSATYAVSDVSVAEVEAWYQAVMAEQEALAERARLNGERLPVWEGAVKVRASDNGVMIETQSICFKNLG